MSARTGDQRTCVPIRLLMSVCVVCCPTLASADPILCSHLCLSAPTLTLLTTVRPDLDRRMAISEEAKTGTNVDYKQMYRNLKRKLKVLIQVSTCFVLIHTTCLLMHLTPNASRRTSVSKVN